MQLVNFLAQTWGISLAIISFSLLLRPKNIDLLFDFIQEKKNLPLLGAINVVIGAMLVLGFNSWTMQWQIVVTILGWLVLLRGVALLLIPETVTDIAHGLRRAGWIHPILAALVSLGCWLVYMGVVR